MKEIERVHLDANVILRFLRDDDPVQSPQARKFIQNGRDGKFHLVVSPLCVAEVFYALRTSYKLSRDRAAQLLKSLLETGVFEMADEVAVLDALDRVLANNVDFGDAMLAAEAHHRSEAVATFDHDFQRFKDVKRYPL